MGSSCRVRAYRGTQVIWACTLLIENRLANTPFVIADAAHTAALFVAVRPDAQPSLNTSPAFRLPSPTPAFPRRKAFPSDRQRCHVAHAHGSPPASA